jgi:nitrogen fixation NifU-like protein
MASTLYTKRVLRHFRHPKNMGKIKNPDGLGKAGNIVCGDVLWLYLKIKNEKIIKCTFETFGCPAAIATSSVITEMVKGKSLKTALKITNTAVVKRLGTLPKFKLHCSVLAVDALREAIYDYLSKHKLPIPARLRADHERISKASGIVERRHGW